MHQELALVMSSTKMYLRILLLYASYKSEIFSGNSINEPIDIMENYILLSSGGLLVIITRFWKWYNPYFRLANWIIGMFGKDRVATKEGINLISLSPLETHDAVEGIWYTKIHVKITFTPVDLYPVKNLLLRFFPNISDSIYTQRINGFDDLSKTVKILLWYNCNVTISISLDGYL